MFSVYAPEGELATEPLNMLESNPGSIATPMESSEGIEHLSRGK